MTGTSVVSIVYVPTSFGYMLNTDRSGTGHARISFTAFSSQFFVMIVCESICM